MSDRERRVLESIEQELRRSDPQLVRRFARLGKRRHHGFDHAAGPRAGGDGAGIGHRFCARRDARHGHRGRRARGRLPPPARLQVLGRARLNVSAMLVERMAPFTSTIFAEMSALAAAHRRDQPRAGLPGHRRPGLAARRRRRERHRRRQPVPARPGRRRRCARPSPSTRSGSTASTSTPTRADHDRGDGGHRLRGAGAVRAGRRGRHLRAVLRLLRRDDRARPAPRCGPSRCGRRRSPSTRTSCAPRSRRAPGSCWSTPRTTRPARCSPREQLTHDRRAGRRVRRGGRHRRGVRAHGCSTGARTSRWRRCPGSPTAR